MLQAGRKFAELAGRKRRAQQQNTKAVFMPPAQGGINAIQDVLSIPPNDAMFLVNMVPSNFGVHVRFGYREWCQPVPAGDQGVRTIIPFTSQADSITSKLFVVSNDGIYDATVAGAVPVKKQNFAAKGGQAGFCSWHHFNTAAGQFLLVCDEENGYFVYTASTDTWAAGTVSGGPTVDTLAFVTVWKKRVWFIPRNSGSAWYLAVGTISGALTEFIFSNKFKYGGQLRSLWNWTLDGGEGVDDYLAGISSAGDLVVYKGTDPDTVSTFQLIGWWYIGDVCKGRRQGNSMGSELLLLSVNGLLQTSKIIAGLPAADIKAPMSFKINPRLTEVIKRTRTFNQWQISVFPTEQLIFLLAPKEIGKPYLQFVYNTSTQAWTTFLNIPMQCADVWDSRLYLGTSDLRVFSHEGHVDNVLLADAGATANPVDWECLTSFQGYGTPAHFKRVQFVRPQFIGAATPMYNVQVRYDFDLTVPPGSPPFALPASGIWGSGLWDVSHWGGGYIVDQPPLGGNGMGRHVALFLRGRSAAETIHVGTDVMLDSGGML
jgi:hypothetical protein